MNLLSVMGFFCEDIREEKNGVISLIGIIPDNVNLNFVTDPSSPPIPDAKTLTKMCILVRVNFDPEHVPSAGVIRLAVPDGSIVVLGPIDAPTLELAAANAKSKGNPLAGVITRAEMGGFNPGGPGVVRLEVVLGEEVYVPAAINFGLVPKPEDPATSSTAH